MAAEQAGGVQRMGEGEGDRRESMTREEPMLAQARGAQQTPKSRTCSHCGELGHYRTTCPMLSSPGGGAAEWYSPGIGSSLRGCTECGRIGGHKKSCSLAVYESANRMSYPQESPYREPEKRPRDVWKPVEPPRMDAVEGAGKPRYCGACGQAGHYRKTCPHEPGTWFGGGSTSSAPVAQLPMGPPLSSHPLLNDLQPVDVRKELELSMPKPVVIEACPSCLSTTHCKIGCETASRPPPPPPLLPEPSQVQDWPPAPPDWRRQFPVRYNPDGGVGDNGGWKVAGDPPYDGGGWAGNGQSSMHNGRQPPWQLEQDDWIARTARKLGDSAWAGQA